MSDSGVHMRFATSLSDQVAGRGLALEHALVMLFLMVGLLSIQSEQRRWLFWAVLTSIALSLLTPLYAIDMVWPLLSALVLPPLLWQMAVRLATARLVLNWRALMSWWLIAVLMGLALSGSGIFSPFSGLLLGILAASLVWQVQERLTGTTALGIVGPLALAVVLTERDLPLLAWRPLLGSVFASGGLGLILGSIGVRIALRLEVGAARNHFCLGLSYAAYLVGALPPWGLPGASGVVVTVVTALVMALYGSQAGVWPTITALPMILNHRGMLLVLVSVLLVLGWQAHVPLSGNRALATGLGLVAAAPGLLVRYWMAPVPGERVRPLLPTLLRTKGTVFLVLLGSLWLWPAEAVLAPEPLALALLATLLTLGLVWAIRSTVFELVGAEGQSPKASGDAPKKHRVEQSI
jgi:hypothetical protein